MKRRPVTVSIRTLNLAVHHRPCPHRHAGGFVWHVGPSTPKERHPMPLELSMTTEQQVRLTATPVTPGGRPAQLDGALAFSVESGDCTITPVDDRSAIVVASDTPGDSSILVKGDADLGAGVEPLMDTILVHVSHANAASLGLVAGTPELKP